MRGDSREDDKERIALCPLSTSSHRGLPSPSSDT